MVSIRPDASIALPQQAGDVATPRPQFLTGWRFRAARLKLVGRLFQLAVDAYPDWPSRLRALRGLVRTMRENDAIRHITKGAVLNGRLYTVMSYPGGPSPAQNTFIRNELHRVVPIPGREQGLLLAIVAITKKCSLRCEHCFEWENLNKKEQLSVAEIMEIISKLQARGVAQIELSGGEPMNRFGDLVCLLETSDTAKTDFWVLSSGYLLTAEKAGILKRAGLTGIAVSLDHWEAAVHDRFRGLEGSFAWAKAAVQHSLAAGLVTGLSLTASRDFCNQTDLMKFATLARSWGVHFIRILEPRAVGHYAGQSVELDQPSLTQLEETIALLQRNPAYRDFPIIDYYGTYQREVGCSGAGSRYLYVDTDGDYHACPFCQHKCGSAIHLSVTEGIRNMQQACGCHAFHTV